MLKFKNQSGMSNLAYLLFVILIFGASLIFIGEVINYDRKLINQTKGYYCIHSFHFKLREHIKKMETLNNILISTDITTAVLALLPGLQGMALSSQKIKKILKLLQNTEVVSFQKNMLTKIRNGCPLPYTCTMSPYTHFGIKIQRDITEEAIVRKKKWSYYYQLSLGRIIQINYLLQDKKLITQSKAIR